MSRWQREQQCERGAASRGYGTFVASVRSVWIFVMSFLRNSSFSFLSQESNSFFGPPSTSGALPSTLSSASTRRLSRSILMKRPSISVAMFSTLSRSSFSSW